MKHLRHPLLISQASRLLGHHPSLQLHTLSPLLAESVIFRPNVTIMQKKIYNNQ
jgi:hypothetical protein